MDLSIVVPYHGCSESLVELCSRLSKVLQQIHLNSEVIFVVDGPDDADPKNARLDKTLDSYGFRRVNLIRNFGQHAAIFAGLRISSGDLVLVIDCDLQDSPEMLLEMLQSMNSNVDVVLTKRLGDYDNFARNLARRFSRRILKLFYPPYFDLDISSFVLMRRNVVDVLLDSKGHDQIGLLLNWLNFPNVTIPYKRQQRPYGKSSYTLNKLVNHGLDSMSFDLTFLFRRLTKLSIAFICFSFMFTGYAIYISVFVNPTFGWTSIVALVSLGSSIGLTLLSLIGLAISQFIHQYRRPRFVLQRDKK